MMLIDVTPWCWTVYRKKSNLLCLVFHCAPGLSGPLRKALPDGASAYVRSSGRVRCIGRRFVARFLEQQGAPGGAARRYAYSKGADMVRGTEELMTWYRGAPPSGGPEGGPKPQDDTI